LQISDCRFEEDEMNADEMRRRTKEYAKRVIHMCRSLPNTEEARLIRKQVFRCGTSVGSNYRAVCRARSKADFVSKLAVVLEEADESCYWIEILIETKIMSEKRLGHLLKEGNELVSIVVASLKTARIARV
jgi:four helix bundle protein